MGTIVFPLLRQFALSLSLSFSFCLLVLSRRDYPQFSDRPSGNTAAGAAAELENTSAIQTLNLRLLKTDGGGGAAVSLNRRPFKTSAAFGNIREIGIGIGSAGQ